MPSDSSAVVVPTPSPPPVEDAREERDDEEQDEEDRLEEPGYTLWTELEEPSPPSAAADDEDYD